MLEIVIFGLICFAVGLVAGITLMLTIIVKAMKMIPKVGPR